MVTLVFFNNNTYCFKFFNYGINDCAFFLNSNLDCVIKYVRMGGTSILLKIDGFQRLFNGLEVVIATYIQIFSIF